MAIKNPKTPRVTRKAKKVAKMYADNPTWAAEDNYQPKKMQTGGTMSKSQQQTAARKTALADSTTKFPYTSSSGAQYGTRKDLLEGRPTNPNKIATTSKMKKGGATKMKKYAMGGSTLRPATDKANRGMYQEGGGKDSALKNQYTDMLMNSKPTPGSTYQPKITPEQMNSALQAKSKMVGPMTEAQSKRSVSKVETPRVPMMYKKTGGMVNSNAKITATKKATGKSGGTTVAISKTAVKSASPKGRVGGTSVAPKKALPKAQMGTIVGGKIPKAFIKTGKPKAGGAILKGTAKAKMGGMKGKSC